ncbi:MAG: hypothetical protein KDD60_06450 [Bdellovibrionales bacterium]|nr:hypothetical protein [Bdellovibrionales bacterium]
MIEPNEQSLPDDAYVLLRGTKEGIRLQEGRELVIAHQQVGKILDAKSTIALYKPRGKE